MRTSPAARLVSCLTCGRTVRLARTGRPARYCSDKCKEGARRERDRERERFSRLYVAPPTTTEVGALDGDGTLCRVCESRAATVGPTGAPILCATCAAPG